MAAAAVATQPASLVPPPFKRTISSDGTPLPSCWGHRGASAAYPENTLASFTAAIRDGAEGIESDVHVSADGVILMFHDAHLDRTTDGTGRIQTQQWHGGIDKVRTKKVPHQAIPTFHETIALLMQPENSHVLLNIDVKVDNDPELIFSLMKKVVEQYPNWQETLAPRLILGLWHPKYLGPAKRYLTGCRLAHIGLSPAFARRYFWDACDSFSMNFGCLVTADGELFRKQCKAEGKDLFVWTVNKRKEMIEATKWGAKAILTDRTADFLLLRGEMEQDWNVVSRETSWMFPWTSFWYTSLANALITQWELFILSKTGGDFAGATPPKPLASVVR